MNEPGLVPSLAALRAELNALAPNRDRSSDGWVGDAAHQSRTSDHNWDESGAVPIRDADKANEVHAIDLDSDLREPGLTMEMVVQHVLKRCRTGQEKRLRYVIYRQRIWEASNGWKQRDYGGESPHIEHAHFSGSYETSREASVASWDLEGIEVALTAADKNWIKQAIADAVSDDLLAAKIGDKAFPGRTVGDVLRDLAKLRGVLFGSAPDTANAAYPATSPLMTLFTQVKTLFGAAASNGAKP